MNWKTRDNTAWVPNERPQKGNQRRRIQRAKEKRQPAKQKVLIKSMDLVVDGEGFLVPRQQVCGFEDRTIPPKHDDDDDVSIDAPYSRLIQDSVQRSLSKTSSAMLTEADELENSFQLSSGDLFISPQRKSTSKFSKSSSTLETEAMTRTTISDFQDSFIVTPSEPSFASPQTPTKLFIPGIPDSAMDEISLLPDRSPGYGFCLNEIPKPVERHESMDSTIITTSEDYRSSLFMPGVTASGRTMPGSIQLKDVAPSTPPPVRRHRKREESTPSNKVDFAPLNRSTRRNGAGIEATSRSPGKRSPRKNKSMPSGARAPGRHIKASNSDRSPSTLEKRPPTPIKRKLRLSPKKLSPMAKSTAKEAQTPTSKELSSRTVSTSNASRKTGSSSSGRTLSDHFLTTQPVETSIELLARAMKDLPFIAPDGEESNTGAVIIRTRKVPRRKKKTG